jgi:hypothetical protein
VEVNFNTLRKKLISDYNNVIDSLNYSICEDTNMDRVNIPIKELKSDLDRLRIDIITIGALCDPNIKDCACILDNDTEVKQFGSI